MKGSHATDGGWEPREYYVCGERVTISGKNERGAIFSYRNGRPRSRHANCWPLPRVVIEGLR